MPTFGFSAPCDDCTDGRPHSPLLRGVCAPGQARLWPSPTPWQESMISTAQGSGLCHLTVIWFSQSLTVGTQVGLWATSEPVRVAGRKQALSQQTSTAACKGAAPASPEPPPLGPPWGPRPLPAKSGPFRCSLTGRALCGKISGRPEEAADGGPGWRTGDSAANPGHVMGKTQRVA